MASRTKQKEEARARRVAEERARLERQRRDRRLRMIGGVILAAVVVIAVAIAISSGGGGSKGLKTGTQATQAASQVSQMFAGIHQSGAVLGNPKAPVTMSYYGDLECPSCKAFTLQGGWPQLVANDVRAGKVKVVFRAFQTATPNPQTFVTQQTAALAAGKQNRFWDFAELFYREQGQEGTAYVNDSYLTGLAKQVPGLNVGLWQTARNDPALASQVQSDQASARTVGANVTPTLIFQGPKGASGIEGGATYSDLQKQIQKVS